MRLIVLSSSCFALLAASCGSSPAGEATRLTAGAPAFGTVLAGDVVTSHVTVRNRADASTRFAPLVFLEADPSVTTLTTTCTAPLAPGAECVATIEWRPTVAGDLVGTLVILDDPSNAADVDSWAHLGQPSRAARSTDLVLPLKGVALPPDRLEANPSRLTWPASDTMAPRTVHLSSTGHVPARTASTLTGVGARNFGVSGCPAVLAPGDACDLYVFPLPVEKGRHTAQVTFEHIACDLEIMNAVDLIGTPDASVPTKQTLRALAQRYSSTGDESWIAVGDKGTALRGKVGAWKDLSIATGEDLLRVDTFGGDDHTIEGMTYTYPADQRDLVVASGTHGSLFVARTAAPFVPLASGLTTDVVGLLVSGDYQLRSGSVTTVRPYMNLYGRDGQRTSSLALAPAESIGNATSDIPGTWNFVENDYVPLSATTATSCIVAGGPGGALSTSYGGAAPSAMSGVTETLYAASSGTLPVVVGEHGAIYSSKDCETWTREDSGTTATLRGVAVWQGSEAVRAAVGDGGTVLVSRKGGPWVKVPVHTDAALYAVGFGSSFVAVGANGTIVRFN